MRARQDAPEAPRTAPDAPIEPAPAPDRAAAGSAKAASVGTIAVAGVAAYLLYKIVSDKGAESRRGSLWSIVLEASSQTGVPPEILGGLINAESSWRVPNEPGNAAKCGVACANSSCAAGLTQMKRAAVSDVGGQWEGICIPANAILWGARYLARLNAKYNNWDAAIQAYNVGPGAYDRGERNERYASAVMKATNKYRSGGAPAVAMAGGRLKLFSPRG